MLNIIVCIKQVPDTLEVKINPKTNNLDREGINLMMNPVDKNAIEEALQIRKNNGGLVTVISMGPPNTKEVLREALAMGADEAILLSDRKFAGADTWATTLVLEKAIKNLDKSIDIILCGKQAVDADTGQVGPGLAERLNIGQITFVKDIKIDGDYLIANRLVEEGYEKIQAKLPALLTVIEEINTPRYAKPLDIMKAARKSIMVWNSEDLSLDEEEIGQRGSPTCVGRLFTPQPKGQAAMFEGDADEACSQLIAKLQKEKII